MLTKKQKRHFLQMGSGLGKSFVMAHLTTVLLHAGAIDSVTLIFSEPELLRNEEAIVERIRKMCAKPIVTKLMTDLYNVDLPATMLTICDEADRMLFGDTRKSGFPSVTGDGFFLGLSATGLGES